MSITVILTKNYHIKTTLFSGIHRTDWKFNGEEEITNDLAEAIKANYMILRFSSKHRFDEVFLGYQLHQMSV
jgi:hypothetical protein